MAQIRELEAFINELNERVMALEIILNLLAPVLASSEKNKALINFALRRVLDESGDSRKISPAITEKIELYLRLLNGPPEQLPDYLKVIQGGKEKDGG